MDKLKELANLFENIEVDEKQANAIKEFFSLFSEDVKLKAETELKDEIQTLNEELEKAKSGSESAEAVKKLADFEANAEKAFAAFQEDAETAANRMVEDLKDEMSDVVYRRSRFVVGEISRIQELVKSLKDNNFENVGKLMAATHYGLSNDYEVSCEELDFLVDNVLLEEGVLGARVMGGGFGGCTINLLKKTEVENVIEKLSKAYQEKFGIALTPYQVSVSEGTHFYA